MFLKKFLIIFLSIILLFCGAYNLKNEILLNVFAFTNTKTNQEIKINNIYPDKYQQYIVSKPTIEITFNNLNLIDKSSTKLYINYKDVTDKSTFKNNKIVYTPNKKFKRGNQIVKLELCDINKNKNTFEWYFTCLLYTSDAADDNRLV